MREGERGNQAAACDGESRNERGGSIYIEAVVVFSAGAFQIGEYERVLQDWIDVDGMVKREV